MFVIFCADIRRGDSWFYFENTDSGQRIFDRKATSEHALWQGPLQPHGNEYSQKSVSKRQIPPHDTRRQSSGAFFNHSQGFHWFVISHSCNYYTLHRYMYKNYVGTVHVSENRLGWVKFWQFSIFTHPVMVRWLKIMTTSLQDLVSNAIGVRWSL